MDKRIAEWMVSGDTGSSSKSIMLWLSAKQADKTWGADVPRDAWDLGRCIRLLDRIPEWRARMPEMAEAGGLWPTVARRWTELERVFSEDWAGQPSRDSGFLPDCSRTNALLSEVLAEARATDKTDFSEITFGDGKLKGCSVKFAKDSPYAEVFAKMAQGK